METTENITYFPDLGHWKSNFPIPIDTFGFIYLITNLVNNRKYLGKKQIFTTKKRPPLKGKQNKRHFKVETDWKSYTSSSNELNEDIQKLGIDNFHFEIIKLCSSKWELAFYEAKLQFEYEVLLKEEYYNGIINCRIGKSPKH